MARTGIGTTWMQATNTSPIATNSFQQGSSLSGPAQVDAEYARLRANEAYATNRFNSLAAGTNQESNFNRLMASNSRPIQGSVSSVGPFNYRGQQAGGGRDDLVNADLGVDEYGNRVDLQPINLPDAPQYSAPEVDQSGVDRYSRSNLAPMLARLRSALNQNVLRAKNEDNPNVRERYTRAAMTGFGDALSSASASSRNTGRNDYMNMEYRPQVQAAQANYQTSVNKYQAESTDMLNRRRAAMSAYRA